MSYRFHTLEEKLEIVQKIKSGIPLRKLSGEYKILMRIIIEWNRRYNLYGEEGLVTKNRNQNYSIKQKNEIIDLVLKRKLSLPQVAVYYNVSETTIRRWVKVSTTSSTSIAKKMINERKTAKDRHKPEEGINHDALDKLIKENTILKVELALLKKVRALVEKRESPTELNGQEPSKN